MDLAEQFSAQHRDLLLELSLLISERRGVDEIFASFADHVRHGATFDFTSLFVVTADPALVRTVGNYPQFEGAWLPGSIHEAPDTGADRVERELEGTEYNPRRIDIEATRALAAQGYQRAWAMPLYVEGRNYGMLSVAKKAPGRFPDDHIRFLKAAATLLATAVRQDLELDAARRNAARAVAASELVIALQAGEPIDDIFSRLPGLLRDCLDVDYIGLVMDQGHGFVVAGEAPAGVHKGLPATDEGTRAIHSLSEGNTFLQFRVDRSVAQQEALAQAGYRRSGMAFLRDGEDLRGVLLLARTSSRRFDSDERVFIEMLRSILSQSLSNQQRLIRTEAAAARAHTLNEVALLLNAGEDIEAIFQRLLDLLDQSLEVDFIGLVEAIDHAGHLRQVGARPELVRSAGAITTAKETGLDAMLDRGLLHVQFTVSEHAERSVYTRALADAGMKRGISLVIHHGAEAQGILSLARKIDAPFTDDEEAFLKTLTAMLGEAMAASRRLRRAQTEAARNALLGNLAILLNNGETLEAFFEILSTQLQKAVPFEGLVLMVEAAEPRSYRVVEGLRRQSFQPGQVFHEDDFGDTMLARFAAGEVVVEGETSELGGGVALAARANGMLRGAVASIRHGSEVVGYLLLGRAKDDEFTQDERAFIELVSALAGQAIANLKKANEREVQGIRSRVLSELSAVLEDGESIETHFSTVSQVLLQAVGFDFLSITVRDPATGGFRYIRTHELLVDGQPLVFDPESLQLVSRNGQPSVQYLTSGNPRNVPRALYEAGFRRAASALIPGPSGPEGLLTIGRENDFPFTEDEMAFIGLLAALFGQASANHQKAYAREAEAARNRVLGELALLVNNGEPIDSHFARLAQLLLELQGFDFCALTARTADREGFRVMRSQPLPGEDAEARTDRIAEVREAGVRSIQYGPETGSESVPRGLFTIGVQRAATVLLSAGASDEGLLTIGKRHPDPFTPQEMTFFELVGTLLAYAIANEGRIAKSQAEAEEQAIIAEAAASVARETSAIAIIRGLRTAVSRFIPTPFMSFGYLADGELRFPANTGSDVVLPLGPDFVAALENGQQTVMAERVGTGTPQSAVAVVAAGIHSHVLTRVQSGGVPTGILVLGSRNPAFSPSQREERLCRLIADIVGPAMLNARAAEIQRAEAEDQAIVAEAAAAVARESAAMAITASLHEAVSRFIPDPFVRFAYLEDGEFSFPAGDGKREAQPMGPYFRQALATGQEVVPPLTEREARGEVVLRSRRARLQSHVLTRADSAGTTVGLLLIGSRNPHYAPGGRELRLCGKIADIVGPAMANARAAERERLEGEDQAIIAEAAAAVASESSPLAISRALRGAVSRFIPRPYVTFGFLEPGVVNFVTRDGTFAPAHIGEHFTRAFAEGQASVLSTAERVRQGEHLPEMVALGIQAHLLTTAHSAGTIVGLLLIGSRDESFVPGPREFRLCRLIADIVGPAMANARAGERERQEADNQRILAEVGAVAAREANPQDILTAIRRPLSSLVPLPVAVFGFRDGNQIAFPQPNGGFLRTPLGPYTELMEESGQIHGAKVPPDLAATGLGGLGLHAICATAVRSAGITVGYLIVGSRSPGFEFDERALQQCLRIAQVVGPAMENARAASRARLDAEEQSILAEAAAALAAGTSDGELTSSLEGPIQRFLPGALVSIFFLQGDQLASSGGPLGPFGPQAGKALATGQVVVERPWPEMSELGRRMVDDAGLERFVITALSAGGESRGILFTGIRDSATAITGRDLRLLRLISDMAGPAYANARESARRQADAEEQRVLAAVASAAARAENEAALVHGIASTLRTSLPGARIDLFCLEGDGVRSIATGKFLPIGPQWVRALRDGEAVGTSDDEDLSVEGRTLQKRLGIKRSASFRLASGGQALGLFWVGTTEDDVSFSENELRVYRLLADIIGPALANNRESQRRKEDAEEQRILAEAAAALAAGTSELDILQRLIAPIRAFIPRARVSFSYAEGEEMWLFDGRYRRPIHAHARRALDAGQAIADIATAEVTEGSRELIEGARVRHWVDTAAHAGGSAIGLLFVGTPVEEFEFSERDLRRLRLIADVTGPAMVNAREQARRQQDADEERMLSEIAAIAARATQSSEIVDSLPRVFAPVVPGAFAVYGIVDGDTVAYQVGSSELKALVGAEYLTLPLTPVGKAARDNGQAVGSLASISPERIFAPLGLQEYVLTSYVSTGAPLGMLLISSTDPDYRFSERLLALFRRVAQVVGPAVETARAEAERARQAELYSLILRSLSEGVVLSDIDGKMVFANTMGRSILKALDARGSVTNWREILELLPDDLREGYRAVYERGEGSRGRTKLEVLGKDAWFDYELVPLNDPVMKILLVAADVTADVEREREQLHHRDQMEQAQRLAALGELIGGVAHELNNPLTAILGFAEVMSLSPDAAPLAEDLGVIQKEALRARNIVRDLLFIVRPGTSERSLIPVSDLIGHIERLRRTAWTQQGVGWEINIQEPCLLWGNEHQLTQVMLNLVTNAEHALEGCDGKRITIRAATKDGRTEISVSDTGAGMDEATRNRVFEPFFTTKHGHGTGLGLPLSYSIVQSHDGEFSVSSVPGKGTTFTISLPAAQDTPPIDPGATTAARQGVIRVLVVDDEPSLRKVCQRLISSMGHECSVAENSATALELCERFKFDVVLCDYRLAAETADDVLAGFERVAPELIARTVIATGATTDPGVLRLTERHGLKLIAKPYGAEELATVIAAASHVPAAGT